MMKLIRDFVRYIAIALKKAYLIKLYGMSISKSARISYGAKLDKTYPRGIIIGAETYVASGSIIFSHDFSRSIKCKTKIGSKCFIGANVIIMPGVEVGNEVIIGSGSVVTKNVPPNVIIAGNPSKIIKTNIRTEKYGKLKTESNKVH